MHETFLVIRTAPADMGSRPLKGPFASPDITVGPDGRPRVVVWNLGTRDISGVVTEFAAVPAGQKVCMENRRVIGHGNLAIIPANNCVTVTCQSVWPRLSQADVLIVTAHHPEMDQVKAPYDPLLDRRVGQMNYAWGGSFQGRCESTGLQMAVQIRPANGKLYRVKVFVEQNGRLPSHPQVDRTMAPHKSAFRWQEHHTYKKEDWYMEMLDNNKMSLRCVPKMLEEARETEPEIKAIIERE